MNSSRLLRRGYAVALVVTAAFLASALGGSAHAGSTAAPAANVHVTLDPASAATSPGGAAEILVTVSNLGRPGAPSVARPSVDISAPAGYTYDGATNIDRVPGFGGFAAPAGRWSCRRAREGATCSYGGPLKAGAALVLLTRWKVPATAKPGGVAIFRAVGTGTAAGRTGRASMRIVKDGVPVLYVESSSTEVREDKAGVETIEVLNTGPVASNGVQLSNLLPDVVGTWSASGGGWTCTGAQGTPPSCSSAARVKPGGFAPKLRIKFSVDPTRAAALHLQTGGKPAIQQWSIKVTAQYGTQKHEVDSPAELAVAAPPGALLVTSAVSARGLQELLPGDHATIRARIGNVGRGTTRGALHFGGTIPAGTSITGLGGLGAWQCEGGGEPKEEPQAFGCASTAPLDLAPGKSLTVSFDLDVATSANPGKAQLVLAANAENEIASARPRATSMPLLILEGNAGFPGLTLLRAGKHGLEVAGDGEPIHVVAGKSFVERLDVRNAGGAAIAAGSRLLLTQHLGGTSIASIRAPAGWRCSGGQTLSCELAFGADLAAAASLEGPTVTVTTSSAAKGTKTWPATVRLEGAGEPKAASLPVLVTLTHGAVALIPNFTNVHVPTAGGAGAFGLSVRNAGNIDTAGPVQLAVHLPGGAHLARIEQNGWRCSLGTTSARCTSPTSLEAGHHLSHLVLHATFAARTGMKVLKLTAHASVVGHRGTKAASATLETEPRHALHANAREPERVAFADQPLVRAKEKLTSTIITLEGDGSGGNGLGLRYRWTQRCLSLANARMHGSHCSSVTPAVKWLGSRTEADTRVALPQVKKATWLVFDLAVTDGSASSSDFVRLKVLPLAKPSAGFTIRHAHPKREKSAGPLRERRKLPKPAEPLKNTPKKDTAPPPVPHPDSTPAATTTATSSQLPAIFCQIVRDAINSSGSFNATVGGVSFGFENVSVSTADCSDDTVVTFSGATFGVGTSLDASGISGSVSKSGVTLSGGTLRGPASWHSPTFTLAGGGLSVPFGAGTVSLSGTVEASGIAFIPLPNGWTGTTSVSFSAGSPSGTSVSATVTATGPKVDASPDSPAPSATVSGAIASDGTFSLSFDVQQVVQLAGGAVNLSGSVKRDVPGGAIKVSAEGSLASPVTIVQGLAIQTMNVKIEPTEDSLGIEGSGLIELSTPSGKVGVHVGLTYADPSNWKLTAAGVGDTAWTPLPGLSIKASDFSGSIEAKNDAYELTLKAELSTPWTISSSVSVPTLGLTLSNVCPDTGAPCPKDASLFLDLKGSIAFTLPGVGSVDANVAGALALPSGEFSVEASLGRSVSVGAGISIDSARVLIQRGLTLANEEPTAETADAGGFRVDLMGAVSVPGIGQLPTVHASFSSRGWAVAVPLGSFSIPGSSGDGSKLGSAVVGWASYATTMKVVDPVTKAVTSIQLPANAFKLTGSFSTPGWLADMLKLPGDIKGRATGTFDPSTDTYALRMAFEIPGQPYLYGSATSATNVRLRTTYFEILRQSGDFNIALGGEAALNTAAGGGLESSTVDLGLALSYAITSQTVAGSLTFSSPTGWQNAFGARELTLYDLAVAFSFNIPTLTPSFGFGARAVLPPTIRQQLGQTNGARTTLVANISITNPCLGIQVDDPTNTGQTVLSIGNGAVTAKAFELQIAPTGCTVGQFTYGAGISVRFDGAVAGISVAIEARIGLSPFGFDGTADIGEIPIGGLTIKKTHLEVSLSTSRVKVEFSGGVEAFGTNVDIAGRIEKNGTTVVTDFTGKLDKLSIGEALTAQNLGVTIHTETGATNVLKFSAQGSIQLLGSTADGKFALSLANGQLNEAKADVKALIKFGDLSLDGTFKVDYSKTRPLAISANVAAKWGKTTLANASVVYNSGYLAISAGFNVGNVFSAQLDGAAYFGSVPAGSQITLPSGSKVTPKTGDFFISAKDVRLSLGGFTGVGNVWVGKAGGLSQAYLSGSVQILGTSGSNNVFVSGSIDGDGNFSLAGSAALDLAGFKPTVAVSMVKQGATVSVSGAASIQMLSSTVALRGEFRYDRAKFLFRLRGTATLVAGGYTLADSTVAFSNLPEDAGLYADVALRAGSTLAVNGRININAQGGFYLSANASLNLRAFTVNGTVTFFAGPQQVCSVVVVEWRKFIFGRIPIFGTRCETRDYPATLNAAATVSASGFSFGVTMTVSGNGSFRATARTPVSGETTLSTGTVSLVVVRGYAEVQYHMGLTIQSSSPYVAVEGAGSASVKYQHWDIRWYPWESGWSRWKTLVSVSVSLQTDPFKACAYASLYGKNVGGCVS
ncbi:MAG: hypothetical protein ACJ77E_16270 [Gaiellaceae bacterium]